MIPPESSLIIELRSFKKLFMSDHEINRLIGLIMVNHEAGKTDEVYVKTKTLICLIQALLTPITHWLLMQFCTSSMITLVQ